MCIVLGDVISYKTYWMNSSCDERRAVQPTHLQFSPSHKILHSSKNITLMIQQKFVNTFC